MFAYQTAALRRGVGIASIITFGSPVDLHRGLPAIRRDVAGAIAEIVEPALSSIISHVEGLPSILTSTAFKVISGRKEIKQRVDFVRSLHDRSALVRREARRRFLGGEGFVAWPGPALRVFVDDFIVHNRMLSGGFVIDGRTVTLADIEKPILAFVGGTDDIARPPTIRAITDGGPEGGGLHRDGARGSLRARRREPRHDADMADRHRLDSAGAKGAAAGRRRSTPRRRTPFRTSPRATSSSSWMLRVNPRAPSGTGSVTWRRARLTRSMPSATKSRDCDASPTCEGRR